MPDADIRKEVGALNPQVLYGQPAATALYALCAHWHQVYQDRWHRPIRLGILQVGDDPASQVYVKRKAQAAAALGLEFTHVHLPACTSDRQILTLLKTWSGQLLIDSAKYESMRAAAPEGPEQDGILLQLPLPAQHQDHKTAYLAAIAPSRDVDGLCPTARSPFIPCTALGCLFLLAYYSIPVAGVHVVVVGRSALVGRPLAQLLLDHHATVTIAHSYTRDLPRVTRTADILCVAAGHRHLITPQHMTPGCVVVDVGMHRMAHPATPDQLPKNTTNSLLTGDVHPDVYPLTQAYSPVPGGVGVMTVACLMWNTVVAAFAHRGITLDHAQALDALCTSRASS